MNISTILAFPCLILLIYGRSISEEQDQRTLESQPKSWKNTSHIRVDTEKDGTPTAILLEHERTACIVRDLSGRRIRFNTDGNQLVRGVTPDGKKLYWLQEPGDKITPVVFDF